MSQRLILHASSTHDDKFQILLDWYWSIPIMRAKTEGAILQTYHQ
jgi:hypothetical protein